MLVLWEGALFDIGPELEGGDPLALQAVVFGSKVAAEFGVTRLGYALSHLTLLP